jgi:hypothetical protein
MNPPQQSRVDKTMKLHTNRTILRIVNTKMAIRNAVRETNTDNNSTATRYSGSAVTTIREKLTSENST